MQHRRRLLPALALLAVCSALAAAEPPRLHVDDPAHLLPLAPPDATLLDKKLSAFEHDTGITILVEFHPKPPPADEDKIPGAYMRALSAKLGTAQRGVLAVYFADEDDWRLWIGDDLAATFAGQSGTAAELTKNHAIHDAKEALFAAARAAADAAFAKLKTDTPAAKPPSTAQRVALQADAIIERLLEKFGPK